MREWALNVKADVVDEARNDKLMEYMHERRTRSRRGFKACAPRRGVRLTDMNGDTGIREMGKRNTQTDHPLFRINVRD